MTRQTPAAPRITANRVTAVQQRENGGNGVVA